MIEAPVGFHCPACVEQGRRRRGQIPLHPTHLSAGSGQRATRSFTAAPTARPVITYAFIALCVVVYLFQAAPRMHDWLGLHVPDLTGLFAYAPLYTSTWYWEFEPWRMLTSAVLHHPTNVAHIGFNMLALWFVGRVMEPQIGRLRFAVLLVFSAFGGSVAILLVAVLGLASPFVPTVGASGAVFGLFGALFVLMRSSGASTGGILALVGVNMVISFMVPNISWQGHLGGLVTGAAVAAVYAYLRGPRQRARQSLALVGLGAILLGLTTLGIQLLPLE
ncbi:rhomboid family intramembrane serine protease [Nesterenkonia ebinurensis]|uniref:rhomboid family intramembrane serine protease n=1 Tax=Nesterenkonia ebinurensis TaxID=2608252 RepID=UPI001CC622F7|nr:rhomboid family intramembrane serine protease [Nesterenkonia ebinurensis]